MDLKGLKTEDDLKTLIIEKWGYAPYGDRLTGISLDESTRNKILVEKIIANHEGFHVLYFQLDETKKSENQKIEGFMRTVEREVVGRLDRHERNTKLFVFGSEKGDYWHFVNALNTTQVTLRRFSISPDNREKLRTAQEQLAKIEISSKADSIQEVIKKHERAFDVEEVTNGFFKAFGDKFVELMKLISIVKRGADHKELSDITQIILNRLIFLKFIEKKGWLDGDHEYLFNKFQDYYDTNKSYWLEVICPLFDLLSEDHKAPDPKLGEIPFLNGGLFGKEPKNLFTLAIPNEYFKSLFEDVLNRFNFTIDESSPLSVEVAVDPEMLGRIFESLVLIIEKSKDIEEDIRKATSRRATGSYYTPRNVVFHMSRVAIAKSLSKNSGISELDIRKMIDIVVDEIPDDEQVEKCHLSKTQIQALFECIENITICDPAVGSGAFLLICLQILVGLRRYFSLVLNKKPDDDYILKEKVISNNLIGVDILAQAVHICELRLWLSLTVDFKEGRKPPTLPNLSYRIFQGDSIKDHLLGEEILLDKYRPNKSQLHKDPTIAQDLNRLKSLKSKYFDESGEAEKNRVQKEIYKRKLQIAIKILEEEHAIFEKKNIEQQSLLGEEYIKKDSQLSLKKEISKEKRDFIRRLKDIYNRGLFENFSKDKIDFVWLIDLVEFFVDHGQGGFDIVIGNPPYGIKMEERTRYGLESKDSYGVFTALALDELLKEGGVLSFITSDTWQTIKSHKPLRKKILDNANVHELLMMPSWIFGATVNTSILTLTKLSGEVLFGKLVTGADERDKSQILACDFTRTENPTELDEYIYSLDNPKFYSSAKVAFYQYEQGLVRTNTNIPFFVGSPKLFQLMNDKSCQEIEKEMSGKKLKIRQIKMNGKTVEMVRFGDIANIKQGLATGDNKSYLYQNPLARGSYKDVNAYKDYILTERDINKIANDEMLRSKVVENGFHKAKDEKNFDEDLWFEGRYIAPHDKGGECDTSIGFLPNYYVPTEYYIDWSTESVKRLKKITIKERDGGGPEQLAAVIRNPELYFKRGITYSTAGVYSPTFRIGSASVFGHRGSTIFTSFNTENLLGILCSKTFKYFLRNYENHTIAAEAGTFDNLTFPIFANEDIVEIVSLIIEKQKQNLRYDYMSNEQKEIDKLVYGMYGLSEDDIQEVENWYARRYPKLARFCNVKEESNA